MNLEQVLNIRTTVLQLAVDYSSHLFNSHFLDETLEVSLGIGLTETPNDFRLAVRLRAVNVLHSAFEFHLKTLATLGGYIGSLDILTTGPVRAIGVVKNGAQNQSPLGIGASVGLDSDQSGGTLGFFARRRSDKKVVGLVSANHVIAGQDLSPDNAKVVHPAHVDGASTPIALLDGNFPKIQDGAGVKTVDCAFAVLDPGINPNLSSLGTHGTLVANIGAVTDLLPVFKIGRTTNLTQGKVRAYAFDHLTVRNYRKFDVSFQNQIEIESATNHAFSAPGDSGSLVWDAQNRPVGLLFADTAIGGANNLGLHYANPIVAVLDTLQVDPAV